MIEALYGIEFVSDTNKGGYGVVVLETGRIFGGDSSFAFVGNYEIKDKEIIANVKCTNDRKVLESIFGNVDEFNLHLSGTPSRDEFLLQGHMVENPSMKVRIKLTRRAELP